MQAEPQGGLRYFLHAGFYTDRYSLCSRCRIVSAPLGASYSTRQRCTGEPLPAGRDYWEERCLLTAAGGKGGRDALRAHGRRPLQLVQLLYHISRDAGSSCLPGRNSCRNTRMPGRAKTGKRRRRLPLSCALLNGERSTGRDPSRPEKTNGGQAFFVL